MQRLDSSRRVCAQEPYCLSALTNLALAVGTLAIGAIGLVSCTLSDDDLGEIGRSCQEGAPCGEGLVCTAIDPTATTVENICLPPPLDPTFLTGFAGEGAADPIYIDARSVTDVFVSASWQGKLTVEQQQLPNIALAHLPFYGVLDGKVFSDLWTGTADDNISVFVTGTTRPAQGGAVVAYRYSDSFFPSPDAPKVFLAGGESDAAIASFNGDHSFAWAATIAGPGREVIADVSTLGDQQVVACGGYDQDIILGTNSENKLVNDDNSTFVAWIAAFRAQDGGFIFANRVTGGAASCDAVLSLNGGQSLVAVISFIGTVKAGNISITSTNDQPDTLLLILDALDGSVQKSVHIRSEGALDLFAADQDGQGGFVIGGNVGGGGQVQLPSSQGDITTPSVPTNGAFLARFDAEGNALFANTYGDDADGRAVTVQPNGDIQFAVRFQGVLRVGDGENSGAARTSAILKVDPVLGETQLRHVFVGDDDGTVAITSLSAPTNDALFVAGRYKGGLALGALSAPRSADLDHFLGRISP